MGLNFLECKKGPLCYACPMFDKGVPVSDRMPEAGYWSGLSIVGEMPNRDEVRSEYRQVFSGKLGEFVNKVETMLGYTDAHVTNSVRCGLPYGVKPSFMAMREAAECCRPLVVNNLKFLGTKCTLHLGALSMFTYLGVGKFDKSKGFSGIDTFRGTCYHPGVEEDWLATCTIHPSSVMFSSMAALKLEFIACDWKKAYELALGERKIWEPDVRDQSKVPELVKFLKEARKEARATGVPNALDVETYGDTSMRAKDALTCDLRTIGVAALGAAYSIPWQGFYAYYDDPQEWQAIYAELEAILADPEVPTVFHNKIFDVPVLGRHFPKGVQGTRHDTLIMHHCIYPKLGHELQSVVSHFLAPEPWKSDYKDADKKKDIWTTRHESDEDFQNLLWYNALDTLGTWEVFQIMQQQLGPWGVTKVYENDIKKQDYATYWFVDGIPLNMTEAERLRVKELQEINDTLTDLQTQVAEDVKDPSLLGIQEFIGPTGPSMVTKKIGFNPRSADQMRAYLFDFAGLIPVTFTAKQMKPKLSRAVLWEMRDDHPFIRKYLDFKTKADNYSRYLKSLSLKIHNDNSIHAVWKPHSTPSGRFGTVPAVQNWNVEMLGMMEAPPGYLFIGADYATLEVRVVAALAPEWPLIEAIRLADKGEGPDIHTRNASLVYYKEIWDDAVSRGDKALMKKLRNQGKPVTFLMNYMGSDDAVYEGIKEERPDEDSKELRREAVILRARYLQKHPAIVEAAEFYHKHANEHMELRSAILGRMRRWPLGNVKPTDAANMPVQSTAADIMDEGTIRWHESMIKDGVYRTAVFPNLQIHDSIFALCKVEHVEKERKRLEDCLSTTRTITSPRTGEEVTLQYPAEASIGKTVKDVKITKYDKSYKLFCEARKLLKRKWTPEHKEAVDAIRSLGLKLRPKAKRG